MVGLSERSRRRWIDGYVDQLLTRDAALVDRGRDPARLRRYLEAYALNSAGLVEDKTLYDAAGIDRRTALAYEALLVNLQVVEALPAWTSNRLKRLTLSPKRYLVDPALLSGIIGVTQTAVLRNGDLLGRVLESFVAGIVLHTGPATFRLVDRIVAAPISTLWAWAASRSRVAHPVHWQLRVEPGEQIVRRAHGRAGRPCDARFRDRPLSRGIGGMVTR